MEIKFNVTRERRKALVTAVSELTGWAAVYKGAPSFAFAVNNYTIDRHGTLLFDEQSNTAEVRRLLAGLADRGFLLESSFEDALSGSYASAEAIPDRLAIEVPLEGFTETALDNLEKLAAGKAALIRKAVGLNRTGGALPIERENGRIRFPWFPPDASPDEATAYTQLVALLCEAAKHQTRVTSKEKPVENEKYAMRCFLLKLGFIGKEYAAARKVLLKNLSGDGSFKSGKRSEKAANTAEYLNADTDATGMGTGAHTADSGPTQGGVVDG